MIWDTLDHAARYMALHPGVAKALRFLAETDPGALPDGRFALDGEGDFFLLQSYRTGGGGMPEAHRAYIDIQCMLRGAEQIGIGMLEDMEETEAHPDRDIWFYRGETAPVILRERHFVILWPEDAHLPCLSVTGAPEPVRKCVVKVKV